MIAQCAVLLHGGQPNSADLVVLGNVGLAGAGIEGQVDAATQSPPGQILRLRYDLQTVGVSQEYTVRKGLVLLLAIGLGSLDWSERSILAQLKVPGIQVEGMAAVEVSKAVSRLFSLG